MGCKHVYKLPLYARQQAPVGKWVHTQKICGNTIYVCMMCGAIMEPTPVTKVIFKLNKKKEVKK